MFIRTLNVSILGAGIEHLILGARESGQQALYCVTVKVRAHAPSIECFSRPLRHLLPAQY